ncbi:MAG: 3-oxoacyl-ACP synthase III family protein, partial [Bacteroidia bacterium]
RHHAAAEESVCEMGANALKKALRAANLKPGDLDLLIYTGGSFDYPIPHNAGIIKSKITDDSCNFYCVDIDSTCLSFLNGLDVAHLYLQANRYNRIAIVCAEMASRAITPEEEKTFGLFGDGAVALIIENTDGLGYTPTYVNFVNYPSGAMLAYLPIGGAINRGRNETKDSPGYFFQMDGKSLIRLTTKHLDEFVLNMEEKTKTKITSYETIIAHQTSRYGNEYFQRHFNLNPAAVVNTLSDYGNCISASIPLGLEQVFRMQNGALKNKSILMMGSAAGLSLGCMILKFD